jgi:hypothetical protein
MQNYPYKAQTQHAQSFRREEFSLPDISRQDENHSMIIFQEEPRPKPEPIQRQNERQFQAPVNERLKEPERRAEVIPPQAPQSDKREWQPPYDPSNVNEV